ncbi:TlpA family protein disulfide reductase, partial [Bacteroidota bacterium]
KGFEVYSVSLDNNKAAWLDAVRFEEYTWIDVCELSYPDSYAASVYNIQEIPTTFLIDKEGNIVAKNINGRVLGTWLDNLL